MKKLAAIKKEKEKKKKARIKMMLAK